MPLIKKKYLKELYNALEQEDKYPTNGEKLKELFPDVTMYQFKSGAVVLDVTSDWWNEKYRR